MRAPSVVAAPELARMVAVGRTTSTSVRLWARVDQEGPLVLELAAEGGAPPRRVEVTATAAPDADRTLAFTYPDDLPGEPPLAPLTRYTFRLRAADGSAIGQGRFQTAPACPEEAPARWTFAFMSCHMPFELDGRPSARAEGMMGATAAALDRHDAKFSLFIGDQIYADEPAPLSIFPVCDGRPVPIGVNVQEIRARFQRQYRRFWNFPALQRLHADRPTACVPDDHEVVNNWGSLPAHADPAWQEVRDGALAACFDYQGSRSFDRKGWQRAPLDQTIDWGNAAVYVLDVRSGRGPVGDRCQTVGDDQLRALTAFLAERGHLDALFVVVSVPLVHIPDWLTAVGTRADLLGGELADRWSHPGNVATRDLLLGLLAEHARAHPQQRVALLSGDIHAGWATGLYATKAERNGPARPLLYQLVSSAMTNPDSALAGGVAKAFLSVSCPLLGRVGDFRVGPLEGTEAGKNPFGGLNVGLVELERGAAGTTIRFKLVSQDERAWAEPRIVFDSGPL